MLIILPTTNILKLSVRLVKKEIEKGIFGVFIRELLEFILDQHSL